ncbi:hypothetical protein POVCU2_0047980 [Plasmodium ovale curtisi]|uniref:Uncharacterized protein n=1 Tax=Plasmodium ovale curtisi TaxID=864141 RepID=A0A1A8W5W5_PLAOA|nr:hypothetical protein POVCU2_0047980 [Plasmodium ovale curtisi]SBS98225.1 hypothetical protein POVCU1_044480 [Plasmodium ovale curtisi]
MHAEGGFLFFPLLHSTAKKSNKREKCTGARESNAHKEESRQPTCNRRGSGRGCDCHCSYRIGTATSSSKMEQAEKKKTKVVYKKHKGQHETARGKKNKKDVEKGEKKK